MQGSASESRSRSPALLGEWQSPSLPRGRHAPHGICLLFYPAPIHPVSSSHCSATKLCSEAPPASSAASAAAQNLRRQTRTDSKSALKLFSASPRPAAPVPGPAARWRSAAWPSYNASALLPPFLLPKTQDSTAPPRRISNLRLFFG